MTALKENYNYYLERIRLGSISIKPEDLPFNTFLIGYFIGKLNCNIDQLFDIIDLLQQLAHQRLISTLLKKQVLALLEDFPKDIRNMIEVLSDYKNGKNLDLIRWIEDFYNKSQRKEDRPEIVVSSPAVPLNGVQVEGTMELQNSSYVQMQQIKTQQLQEQMRMEEQDIELARKMQQQFDKQKNENQEGDIPCEICYCGLYDDTFECLDGCGHFFHINCMAESFKTNILSNNFPILCPKEECKKEVTEGDLKRILDESLFEKYQNHTLKAYAQGHGQSISWCPTANCTYMFFFEKGDPQRFQCLQCKKEYCLNCRVEWHKEMTCKQYKVSSTMSEEDQKFLEFAKGKKFKQCPKCKFWVEKNEGCDHMTCKCKFQFCYKCGGVYMKCECVEEMQREMQRRRQQAEERRRKKEERKKTAAERANAKARAQEEKRRKQEQKLKLREERDARSTRSRRKQ